MKLHLHDGHRIGLESSARATDLIGSTHRSGLTCQFSLLTLVLHMRLAYAIGAITLDLVPTLLFQHCTWASIRHDLKGPIP
jgi:hypothetical protein